MSGFKLLQLRDMGEVNPGVVGNLESWAVSQYPERYHHSIIFDPNMEPLYTCDGINDDDTVLFKATAEAVSQLVGATGRYTSQVDTNIIIPEAVPKYDWHFDELQALYTVSSLASTIGTRGKTEMLGIGTATAQICDTIAHPGDEKTLPGIAVQRFPAGHAIRIVRGAIHTPPVEWMTEQPYRVLTNVVLTTVFS